MNVNSNDPVSITGANQSFSRASRIADGSGAVAMLKDKVPRCLPIEFGKAEEKQLASDKDVLAVSKRLTARN